MTTRITKRSVDSLPIPVPGSRSRIYDDRLTGFGAVRYPSGKTSFFIEYGPRGRQRRMTFGKYGPLDVETARTKAKSLLGRVSEGEDPLEERKQKQGVPSWRAWVGEYLKTIDKRKKRPEVDHYYLEGNLEGKKEKGKLKQSIAMKSWKRRSIASISQRDIERLMQIVAHDSGLTSANRWLASVRACLAAAVRSGLITANPAAQVKKMPENPPRSRVLDSKELGRLRKAIGNLPDPFEKTLFFLLIETGCRKSEALGARWEDLDLKEGVWTIPSPKAGFPQSIPLARSTVGLFDDLPKTTDWVFPSPKKSKRGHRTEVRKTWKNLVKTAKLQNVTLHDIRRTYGLTVAKEAGILAASKLLRHSDTRITSRVYAPLGVEDLRSVAETVTEKQQATVVPFNKAKKRVNG